MRAFLRRCCEQIPGGYSCVRAKRVLQFPRWRVEILDNAESSNSKHSGQRRRPCWRWDHQARPYLIALIASASLGGVAVVYTDDASPIQDSGRKKQVVVLGTGWAGISFLKSLDTTLYDVKVVSPRNYFLFTPLLPSVTCGTVETRSITEPIRRIIRKRQKEADFGHAECFHIDAASKKVCCRPLPKICSKEEVDFVLDYDYLVIAVGAQVNTFNTPGVNEYCLFLKEIEDAERIRERIVDCFENASLPHISQEEREKLLHFVVVGGGPTGVEFAAELHDLIYEDLWHLYPGLGPLVKITLFQSGDHILNMFDHRISDFAEKKFGRDGIDVKTGCRVLKVNETCIDIKDKSAGQIVQVPYGMVVWSTGIATRPVVSNFMEQIGQKDRRVLATDEWLRVKGCDNTYAIGDCATIEQRSIMEDIAYIFKLADKDKSGTLTVEEFRHAMELVRDRYPQIDIYLKRQHLQSVKNLLDGVDTDMQGELDIEQFKNALAHVDSQMKAAPATAQVAAQQGEYLAKCFNNLSKVEVEVEGPVRIRGTGRHRFQPFRYKHFGQFAPLGGEQAAAELPGDWVSVGRSTQWLWYSVYASKQVSWRTRALVIFDWTKRFFFGRDSSRM